MGDYADLRDAAPEASQAKLNLRFGIDSSPDDAAESVKLARKYRLPQGLVSEFREDYRQKSQLDDAREVVDKSPKLRGWLAAEPVRSQMAHDDVQTLGSIEALMGSLGSGFRYAVSAPGTDRGLATDAVKAVRSLAAGAPQFSAGAYGAAAYPFEAVGLDSVGRFFRNEQRASQSQADRLAGLDPNAGLVERGVMSGLRSAGQQLVTLPVGVANTARVSGQQAMLGFMGLTTFGQSYGKARDQGADVGSSAWLGAADATAEVVTERYLGAAKLLGDAKAGMGVAKLFMRDIAREIPGEMGATLWQNFNEWSILHPDKTVKEWLDEQPEQLAETVIATIVGGGAQVGAIRTTQKILGDGERSQAQAQQAEQHAAAIEQLGKLAEASKLNQRDAVTFRELVAEIADEQGEAPTEFTIDAETLVNTLNQAGITPEQIAEMAPTVAAQLRNPAGDIRIPVSEFLAAGEQVTAPLIDHLRTSDDAMTRAEAREFMSAQGDTIRQQVEAELQKRDDQAKFRESIESVRVEFETQLNNAKRFTHSVNKAYSELLANFYGAQAARMGMTPQALLERYGLAVRSDLTEGGRTLDQVSPDQARDTNVPVEMPTDTVFGEAVGNTQGAKVTPDGLLIDLVRFQKPEQEGAQAIRTGVFYLPKGSANAKHYRVTPTTKIANAYGGTEKMEGQTLLRRPLFVKGGTGGKAPEAAYDAIKGKGAMKVLDKAVMDVVTSRGFMNRIDPDSFLMKVEQFLGDFGGDRGLAWEIIANSKQGNTLRYALQEHVIAHAVRDAGYDSVVGYSKGKAGASISEVFDLREQTFPSNVLSAQIHERFLNQSAIPAEQTTDENGNPEIRSADVELAFAQPTERFEFVPAEGQQLYNLAILETGNWEPVGFVELVFEDGKVAGLYDIEVEQSARKGGIGAKVIEAILASNPDAKILISNVVPAARGFWEQVGVPQQNVGEGDAYDGTLDWNTYADSPAGRKRGAARREAGRGEGAGGRGTPRAEGGDRGASKGLLDQGEPGQVGPRAQIALPENFAKSPAIIALFEGADLSSFIHESGHLFLEIQADLAFRIQQQIDAGASVTDGERAIVADINALLQWFGIKGNENQTPLDEWSMMTLDEKRDAHEKFARGFEAYTMEGKAPSLALQSVFSRFRSWLVQVYKTLRGLNVDLNDDVRAVMDRMLATDYAIEEAEAARNMGPLFTDAKQAGMSLEEFNAYQATAQSATDQAAAELQVRGMKDMKWLSRARDKALKARQQEVDELRRDIRNEVRSEVMREPVYRAWQFLTARGDRQDVAEGSKPGKGGKALDLTRDNLFTAIAKLGGLNRDEVTKAWGIDPKDKLESGVFGMPVVRKEGGKSLDSMLEALVEDGYILPDENGKGDIARLEEAFDAQRRGVDQYSTWKDYSGEGSAQPLPADRWAGKLNTDILRDMYGMGEKAIWRVLSARRMTNDRGVAPEVLAESIVDSDGLPAFDSGDALVQALVSAMPPQEVIDARTDQRMLEMFGDISSPEALQRAADEAVHNEARARFIASEMKALEAANKVRDDTGRKNAKGQRLTTDALAKAAREYATAVISGLKVREIRPSTYAAAEARQAKLAEKAFMAGKTEEAALHKRNQLVNNYATRAAYDAQEEVQSAQKYFRKFDKRSKSIDPGYLDQIEQLLERYDFRPATLKEIDRRKSFAEWLVEQREQGIEPNVPAELVDEAGRKSYKDMTVEELRGLRETIEQVEHLGRLKNRLLLARDQRDFDAAAEEMARSIVEHGGKVREVKLEGPNPVTDWFAGVAAQHRKLASLFRQMDGNQDTGPMYELIGRAMNERGTMEDVMNEKATVELQKLYAPLLKMKGGITGSRSKLFIPEINASLTRGGRLAVALNWGNEANRQRLLDGDKWTEGQVRAILRTLSPAELEFVNKTWSYLDTFWPEVAAKEKRLTGVEPEKVQAEPFNIIANDGTEVAMRGGYYPLKYDTDRSDRADQQEAAQVAKEMMQGAFTRATTRRGHTKARLEEVKRAVRKDLNVITQHVTQVTHDLAWHEWLIDTNKLLGDDRVAGAIRDHHGPKVLKTIRDGVMGIATADVAPQTDIDKALLKLRSNVTRATMGASLTTAFLQPFGLTQSMVRIGPKHVLRGMARWGGEAVRMENTLSWVHEKSDFMRLRAKTFNKELREIRGSVAGKSKTMRVVDAGLFAMMQKMQMVADVPTWVGQYEKSIAEGLDEQAAVAMADRMVLESQGGGQTKDLAEVQRKHPMLTQFYSYFSVTLNLAAEQTAATNFKNPAAVAGWLGDMALLMVIPAILPSFIMYALKGGDDDEEGLAKKLVEWQVGYLLGTVVGLRELSGAVGGFDYAGPPVGRLIADLGKAGKQTAQGDIDEPAVMAYINLMGSAFGIPTVQATRSYKGWKAWDEGLEGAGPQSVLFGPPPKK